MLALVPGTHHEPVVRLEGLGYRYPGGEPVLDSVSTAIEAGEFVCVAGESGAGKSTLLRLIFGALQASTGQVWVDGRRLHGAGPGQLAAVRRRLGFVFQDFALLRGLTAIENVRFPLQTTNVLMPYREATRRALDVLQSVGLADRAGAFPSQLSGGQQQRLAIARALVNRPRLLLADEPTGNLDEVNAGRVIELFEEIAASGTAVLVATHDRAVRARAHRLLTLASGHLTEDASTGAARRGA